MTNQNLSDRVNMAAPVSPVSATLSTQWSQGSPALLTWYTITGLSLALTPATWLITSNAGIEVQWGSGGNTLCEVWFGILDGSTVVQACPICVVGDPQATLTLNRVSAFAYAPGNTSALVTVAANKTYTFGLYLKSNSGSPVISGIWCRADEFPSRVLAVPV